MNWTTEAEQPSEVRQVIAIVRQSFPDLKWTRLNVQNPKVDDDGIWFFWLADKLGEVQIESSFGACPFLVETDKHNERFTGSSIQQVAEKIVEWLLLPDGSNDSFWHPR